MNNLPTPSEDLVSRDNAIQILDKHFDDFTICVRQGLTIFRQIRPGFRAMMQPRSRSNLLNDFIVHDASTALIEAGFDENTDFFGAFFILPNDNIALRFKKVDSTFVTRNVNTARQQDIRYQKQIPGFPRVTYLTIGYQVDESWTAIVAVSLVCRHGNNCVWSIPVAETVDVTPLVQDPADAELVRRARVRSSLLAVEVNQGG